MFTAIHVVTYMSTDLIYDPHIERYIVIDIYHYAQKSWQYRSSVIIFLVSFMNKVI